MQKNMTDRTPGSYDDFVAYLGTVRTEEELFSRLTYWFAGQNRPEDVLSRSELVEARAKELGFWQGLTFRMERWLADGKSELEAVGREEFQSRIAEAYAAYGGNRHEGSLVNLGVRYFGLGVRFDLDASYGGNQLFYSLAGRDGQGNPVYQSRPAPDKYYSVGLSATLPLYFQRGYHTRQLSLSAGWNYSNGMVADLGKIEWENGSISNIQRVGFREGLHKVSFGAGFSDQVRMAHRDIAPRWGYTLSANYTFNPENAHFSDLISFYGQAYLPGFAPHNSVLVAATYQTSIGGYKFPSGYAPLSYKSTRLVPRGFTSADIVSNNYAAFQANYQLPVWYPEGGIGSVIYIKRIRLNAGGDYAQFRDVGRGGMTWRRIWSVGGDIVFDFNAFRQPASATSTFKLSCYHPSSGGVYVAASVGLPF